MILDAEKVRGHRKGENPARWGAITSDRYCLPLGRLPRWNTTPHCPMPKCQHSSDRSKMPEDRRSGSRIYNSYSWSNWMTLGATWSEVDIDEGTWTVPAERMKGQREFRIPLSKPALTVLLKMRKLRESDDPSAIIFRGNTSAGMLSNNTMLKVLERLKRPDITTHGFRSSFKDWAIECTSFPSEVSEIALAHVIDDKVEAAYRRGDLFHKRRDLNEAWAAFCVSSTP